MFTHRYHFSSCDFAQARCYYILDHHNYMEVNHQHVQIVSLEVHNYGRCPSHHSASNHTHTTRYIFKDKT